VCVQEANLGKVAKSCTSQIKRSIFFLNYFAHICPEYGFRVKQQTLVLCFCLTGLCFIMFVWLDFSIMHNVFV